MGDQKVLNCDRAEVFLICISATGGEWRECQPARRWEEVYLQSQIILYISI